MSDRFGSSDKVTEAMEILTLIRGELQGIGAGGGGAPFAAQYVTLATHSVLTNERVLTAGDGIDLTDGGAGSTVTLAVDVTDILGAGLTETSNNIVLGTPTTLTDSTTNSVTGTTHEHELDLSGYDFLPAAGGQGHILRAEAGPTWTSYDASTAGGVLIGDGTDIVSDTSPTLVGNLTLDDGSGDSPSIDFVGGANNDTARMYLYDAAIAGHSDFVLRLCDTSGNSGFFIHDSGDALVFRVDSNGGVWIDDGSGNSPAINFLGGTNDDTAKIYLADDATANDSDLVIQLCDAAGDSVLAIHDSAPAAVLEFDSNGNVEFQNDGTWAGRGASSARIEFNASGSSVALYSGTDLLVYSDAGSTQQAFWDGATGAIGVGASTITGLVHLEQSSLTGAKPCITLDQADLDREYFRFIGTAASSTDNYALLGPEFDAGGDIGGWFKIYVQDDGNIINNAYYYIPFYVNPTES